MLCCLFVTVDLESQPIEIELEIMNWMGGRRRHSNNHTKDAAKQYFSRKKETAGANSAPPPGPKAAKKQIESWGGDVLHALRTLDPERVFRAFSKCMSPRLLKLLCVPWVHTTTYLHRFFESS